MYAPGGLVGYLAMLKKAPGYHPADGTPRVRGEGHPPQDVVDFLNECSLRDQVQVRELPDGTGWVAEWSTGELAPRSAQSVFAVMQAFEGGALAALPSASAADRQLIMRFIEARLLPPSSD